MLTPETSPDVLARKKGDEDIMGITAYLRKQIGEVMPCSE
jgi:hypothetical protein